MYAHFVGQFYWAKNLNFHYLLVDTTSSESPRPRTNPCLCRATGKCAFYFKIWRKVSPCCKQFWKNGQEKNSVIISYLSYQLNLLPTLWIHWQLSGVASELVCWLFAVKSSVEWQRNVRRSVITNPKSLSYIRNDTPPKSHFQNIDFRYPKHFAFLA